MKPGARLAWMALTLGLHLGPLRADLAPTPSPVAASGEFGPREVPARHGQGTDDAAPRPDVLTHGPGTATTSADPSFPIGDAWSDPRNPIARLFRGQRLDLWSLKPLQRPAIPPVAGANPSSGTALSPVDRFIRARLSEAGLEPAPEADRRTLARRVWFDLTGLPPTPEELTAYLADSRADAYERLVDRLLASPGYGEHQARLWLDVVRYSDSNGFDWDEFRPEAWRYRDYVVRSFNTDKSFDQFVREQLAGDELLAGLPDTPAQQDLLIATGFLRLGPQDNSASLFNEQARARAEWMFDLTETTGSAFLALSYNCCRCHDHKFDPLSQADYYRLRAFFEPLKYGDDLALDLASDQAAIRAQHAEVDARIQVVTQRRDDLVEEVRRRVLQARPPAPPKAEGPSQNRANATRQAEPGTSPEEPSDEELIKAATDEEKERYQTLTQEIDALQATKRKYTRGLLASDSTEGVPETHLLYQGDHAAERDVVPPGFPSALDPQPAVIPSAANPHTTGRRLALARWIASPTNPLTARVLVNRAWQSFFGQGLVTTPNDFGLAGGRPSHPELLDWLASDFIARGWSVKRLHRTLVTSTTYRQSSLHPEAGHARSVDPANRLLWRQNLRRLSAEQLRDAMLAVAGLLRDCPGGPPRWPELPKETLQANPAFLDDNAEKTKGWYPSPPDQRLVRSLYLVQKRTVRVPFLETFDLPENSASCPTRQTSIVAPQALTLLNGDEPLLAARALAERIQQESGPDPDAWVPRAFERVLQRSPLPAERVASTAFLRRHRLTEFCRGLLNLNEFVFLE